MKTTGQKCLNYNAGAYITLEATFVFQVVFLVLLFLLYISFYGYNSCLLSEEAYMRVLSEYSAKSGGVGDDRYVCNSFISWRKGQREIEKDKSNIMGTESRIRVKLGGVLKIPVFPQSLWGITDGGIAVNTSKEGVEFNQVNFIRICRKAGK